MTTLEVVATGRQTLIQDLGRPGRAAIGVPTGGAADRHSLRLANRLVGNDPGAAGLEVLLSGLTLRARQSCILATTGAPCEVTIDGRAQPFGQRLAVRTGQVITLGTPVAGLRTYLAVAGGISATPTLGSVASSPTLQLGPPPLQPGDVLAAHPESGSGAAETVAPGHDWAHPRETRVALGPRDDWFETATTALFLSTTWHASGDLDRIGIRLSGPRLERVAAKVGTELPSEPMTRGSIQCPPDGIPVILLADHPTTGGYPVIAVVVDEDTDRLAQLRPGDPVRFRAIPRPW